MKLFNLTRQIRPRHTNLMQCFAEVFQIYRFDKLIVVTAEVLKEKLNTEEEFRV